MKCMIILCSAKGRLILNTIQDEELSKFKIYQIASSKFKVITVRHAKKIPEIDQTQVERLMLRDLPEIFFETEQFAQKHRFTKKDKILFVCEGGASSQAAAELFNKAGYSAFFFEPVTSLF